MRQFSVAAWIRVPQIVGRIFRFAGAFRDDHLSGLHGSDAFARDGLHFFFRTEDFPFAFRHVYITAWRLCQYCFRDARGQFVEGNDFIE